MSKLYAIANGRKTGIFASWNDAKKYVDGYSGALYKSFKQKDAAIKFLNEHGIQDESSQKIKINIIKKSSASTITVQTHETYVPVHYLRTKIQSMIKLFYESHTTTDVLTIYTDGSSKGNGSSNQIGGLGVIFSDPEIKHISVHLGNVTNNYAELTAIIEAFKVIKNNPLCKHYSKIIIRSDSTYSIKCLNIWYKGWVKHNWKTSSDTPVKNKQLIITARKLLDQLPQVELIHVFGHNKNLGNEIADQLAVQASEHTY